MFHPQGDDPDCLRAMPVVRWLRQRGVYIGDLDEDDLDRDDEDFDPTEPVFAAGETPAIPVESRKGEGGGS
jgi:hypothetical protein